MNKSKYMFYIFLFIFLLLNINLIFGITNTRNNLNKYFRLHIVANSDNISDQMLKLKVTEAVNNYIKSLTKDISNKNEYISIIQNNINNILNIAKNIVIENKLNYNITAYIGNIKYNEKSYNQEVMKAGTYESLKIVIGNGKGENWWSLLYPNLPDNLTIQDVLINEEIKFESKLIDMFNNLIKFLK